MAWHGSPSSLGRDPYDCDFGVGFWGHATGSSSFVVGNSTGSLKCYLCSMKTQLISVEDGSASGRRNGHVKQQVVVTPTDSFHRRVYFSALGLDLQLEAGQFETLTYDPEQCTITASLVTAAHKSNLETQISPPLIPSRARMVVESPGQGESAGQVPRLVGLQVESATSPGVPLPLVRGGYEVPTTESAVRPSFVLRWSAP